MSFKDTHSEYSFLRELLWASRSYPWKFLGKFICHKIKLQTVANHTYLTIASFHLFLSCFLHTKVTLVFNILYRLGFCWSVLSFSSQLVLAWKISGSVFQLQLIWNATSLEETSAFGSQASLNTEVHHRSSWSDFLWNTLLYALCQ